MDAQQRGKATRKLISKYLGKSDCGLFLEVFRNRVDSPCLEWFKGKGKGMELAGP